MHNSDATRQHIILARAFDIRNNIVFFFFFINRKISLVTTNFPIDNFYLFQFVISTFLSQIEIPRIDSYVCVCIYIYIFFESNINI